MPGSAHRWLLLIGVFAVGCNEPGVEQKSSALSVSNGMVISQIYGGGGGAGASFHNDYVELFNRGNSAVDISGWSVQYGSSTSPISLQVNIPAATVVDPGRYFLIRLGSAGSHGATVSADLIGSGAGAFNISGADGKIALASDQVALSCGGGSNHCTSPSIVDLVGYGAASDFEGTAAGSPLDVTGAIFRGDSGCVDTNDNGSDFAPDVAAPRSGSDAPHPCLLDAGVGAPDLPAADDLGSGGGDLGGGTDHVSGVDAAGHDASVTADAQLDFRLGIDKHVGEDSLVVGDDVIAAPPPPPLDVPGGGCSCRVGANGTTPAEPWLLVALLVAWRIRHSRRA